MIGARRLALASILWVVGCAGAAVQDQAGVTSLAASVSLQANRPRQVVECGGVDEVVNMTFFIDPAGCDSLVPVATTGTVAPRNEDVSIIGSLPHLPKKKLRHKALALVRWVPPLLPLITIITEARKTVTKTLSLLSL